MQEETQRLDVRNHSCPIPLMRTQRLLRRMEAGHRVWVMATDPDAKADFIAYCQGGTSRIVEIVESGRQIDFLIEKL